jgi:hypothetical protein
MIPPQRAPGRGHSGQPRLVGSTKEENHKRTTLHSNFYTVTPWGVKYVA